MSFPRVLAALFVIAVLGLGIITVFKVGLIYGLGFLVAVFGTLGRKIWRFRNSLAYFPRPPERR